jgi:glycosyltransferase 2 family protein
MIVDCAMELPAVDAISRFRRWVAIALGVAALGYLAYAVFRGYHETAAELANFQWGLYVPVLLLTVVNYGARYAKWAWLLKRLDIDVPHEANVWVFLCGLAMVISPGKAGEVLKPWLIRTLVGAPLERTVPALIAERGTDGLAVLILAAIGVSTYMADGVHLVVGTGIASALFLALIASETASLALIGVVRKVGLAGIADRVTEAYRALRTCLSPGPFFVLMGASLVAWWAECAGYWLVFRGLGAHASIGACTFLYSFATVFGGPAPGGLGMADTVLVEGALKSVPDLSGGEAVAAALLIRVATLWFGVLLGAVALLRIESVIERFKPSASAPSATSTS